MLALINRVEALKAEVSKIANGLDEVIRQAYAVKKEYDELLRERNQFAMELDQYETLELHHEHGQAIEQ